MTKYYVAFFLLAIVSNVCAQESDSRLLKGKVTANADDLDGIYVINKQTEQLSITERGGYFSIMAKEGDSLMFSSIQFEGKNVGVAAADFEQELFFVKLETMVHQLNEVTIVKYDHINAVAMGIISKPAKKYTPAERKLRTAGDFKTKDLIGIVAGGMEADPILNALSGRTAMLKKEVEVEKKEFMISMLEDMFDEKYVIEKLKIPLLYVKGFRYYVVENDKFVNILKTANVFLRDFQHACIISILKLDFQASQKPLVHFHFQFLFKLGCPTGY